jgi:transcriptional regulator with XRE-family HTH domain
MTASADYGARIKKLRTERAWSQEKLAELAGLSTRTVQRLERGEACAAHTLRAVATAFKIDVGELITTDQGRFESRPPIEFLPCIRYGGDLFALVAGSHLFRRDNDPLENETEVEAVGSFFQELFDTSEIWDEIGPKGHVEAEHRFTKLLAELEELGFRVFANKKRDAYRTWANPSPMPVSLATVLVLRRTNPAILKLPSGLEVVATPDDEQRVDPPSKGRAAAGGQPLAAVQE